MTREEIIKNAMRNLKTRSAGKMNRDVFVSLISGNKLKDGTMRYQLSFRFTSEAAKKITTNNRIVPSCLPKEHRIYFFCPDIPDTGYTLTKRDSKRPASVFAITINKKEDYVSACGSYDLHYDRDVDMYYIDTHMKLA